MIKVGITIEGASGLTWARWKRLAKTIEACGYHGFYRSDHYVTNQPPDKASLELWVSLTWLADNSKRLEFGPLVTPFTFRHPTMTARQASAVDDLSGGRLLLGLGAGGWEREHHMFGLDLPDKKERFGRFKEGTEVIHLLLNNGSPVSFHGKYYELNNAILLPRPNRKGGPPLLIGGMGTKVTLPLASKFADEWNGLYMTPQICREHNKYLDELITAEGRAPSDVSRSMLTACIYAKTKSQLDEKVQKFLPKGLNQDQRKAVISGTGKQIQDQILRMEEAGLEKIYLVWFDLDNMEGLEEIAKIIY